MEPSKPSSFDAQYLSPRLVISFGVILGIGAIVFSTLLALQTRWLGVDFSPHSQGLQVVTVQANGPASQRFNPGDIVTAIAAPAAPPFALRPLDLIEDPYDLQRYDEFREFFQRQTAIYHRLN